MVCLGFEPGAAEWKAMAAPHLHFLYPEQNGVSKRHEWKGRNFKAKKSAEHVNATGVICLCVCLSVYLSMSEKMLLNNFEWMDQLGQKNVVLANI